MDRDDIESAGESATVVLAGADDDTADDDTVELVDELLIEEISIDGMCGVY